VPTSATCFAEYFEDWKTTSWGRVLQQLQPDTNNPTRRSTRVTPECCTEGAYTTTNQQAAQLESLPLGNHHRHYGERFTTWANYICLKHARSHFTNGVGKLTDKVSELICENDDDVPLTTRTLPSHQSKDCIPHTVPAPRLEPSSFSLRVNSKDAGRSHES
jgi:hypothetical protein